MLENELNTEVERIKESDQILNEVIKSWNLPVLKNQRGILYLTCWKTKPGISAKKAKKKLKEVFVE